ncbi:MAG: alpha/beta fold hydrolase [Rhizomicrobium sp.]
MSENAISPSDPYGRSFPDRLRARASFVAVPVSYAGSTWHTAGVLREPDAARAAIVIVHGSGGVDSRGQCASAALNAAGFATLELDLWAARGVASPQERPKHVAETLPDAFAALDYLSHRRGIDPARIAIMGFSWGGVVSMLSATNASRRMFGKVGQSFAAHAPLYPACWLYNTMPGFEFRDLTGAPIFIQTGADDLYDDPDGCEKLVASLAPNDKAAVTWTTYAGATHAWDRREPDIIAVDPMAHKGKGGEVPFTYNPEIARQSTGALVEFFIRTLR